MPFEIVQHTNTPTASYNNTDTMMRQPTLETHHDDKKKKQKMWSANTVQDCHQHPQRNKQTLNSNAHMLVFLIQAHSHMLTQPHQPQAARRRKATAKASKTEHQLSTHNIIDQCRNKKQQKIAQTQMREKHPN